MGVVIMLRQVLVWVLQHLLHCSVSDLFHQGGVDAGAFASHGERESVKVRGRRGRGESSFARRIFDALAHGSL